MLFDTIHIIFLFLIAILLFAVIILLIRLKRNKSIINKKIQKLNMQFEDEKSYFEKEIKRQNYILEELKHKNGSI